jgi:uncharacterized membrane protein
MNLSAFAPVLFLGVLLVGVLLLLRNTLRLRAGSSVERHLTGPIFRDDDRYWLGGVMYYNPDDPAVLVPNRNDRGWTPNVGHPLGKLLTIGSVVVLLLLALFKALAR